MFKKLRQTEFFRRLDPTDKPLRYRWILTAITFAAFLLAGLCLGILGLYFATGTYKLPLLEFYLQQPKLVLLNTIPYLLLCLIVWLATNRAWIGFLSGGSFCLMYSFTDFWMLSARNDPLFAEDVLLIQEAAQISDGYLIITWQIVLAVCLVALGTFIFFLFFRGTLPHFSLRIALPLTCVAIGALLYVGPYTSENVYKSFSVWSPLNQWFDTNRYISRGGIYPFIYSIPSAFPQEPEGYDADASIAMLQEYATDAIPADKQVNVIVVQLEAFADLSKDSDRFIRDAYADYHRLQEESYCGKLVTTVFSGGTIQTERRILTGFSTLPSFRRTSWSYARYFAEQGYVTQGAHAGYEAFYNRVNVNKNLGLDAYYFIENHFSDIVQGIPKDNVFLPEVARLCLEDIHAGNKVFSFNVTYQNHGPYKTVMAKTSNEYVAADAFSATDYAILNNYLTNVEDTGRQVAAMVDMFRNETEPVVLVFYGDHKPGLGSSGDTYNALGVDISGKTVESFTNYYGTEYMIWANDAAKETLGNEFVGVGPTVSPNYLMNVLFDLCGWEGPSFLKMTDEIMESLPILAVNDRVIRNGALTTVSDLNQADKELLNKLYQTQYYLSQDSDGSLPSAADK
ncbi:MAG: sulfatase-like hydrolase/transferase [Clostridia bacterium]|nr:sulfatase-like hydrolase/transferase [Clostridia bacterium]